MKLICTKNIYNPFYLYSLTFSFALSLYCLGWSNLFPEMSKQVFLFFLFTIISSLILGWKIGCRKKIINKIIKVDRNFIYILFFLYLLSFLYSGGVPLQIIMSGSLDYDIYGFGLPLLHIPIITFSSFFALVQFKYYLISRKKRFILSYFFILLFFVLIVSRSAIMFVLVGSFIIKLIDLEYISLGKIFKWLVLFLFILYVFGFVGDWRLAYQIEQATNRAVPADVVSEKILDLGGASDIFSHSMVPSSFFWGYLYISSPLANFQKLTDHSSALNASPSRVVDFVILVMLPDFISKRIVDVFGVDCSSERKNYLITNSLTVGTIYSSAYEYLEWLGCVVIFIFLMILSMFYLCALEYSNHADIGIAILGTVLTFCIFTNTLSYSALSLQLVYPLLYVKRKNKFIV